MKDGPVYKAAARLSLWQDGGSVSALWPPGKRFLRLFPLLLAGCTRPQSALSPSGVEARQIDPLFWTSTWIGVLVTLMVVVLVTVALYGPPRWRTWLGREWIVVGGGIVLPMIVLTGLFVYGLLVLQAGALRGSQQSGEAITVIGKRWWWEVIYDTADGTKIVSANEIRVPVGRPIRLFLESDNVIHSFWVPRIAGKLDMIPGRTNEVVLQANEPGVFRGQCAEYCGGAHALMAFYLVAMPEGEYASWLTREAQPARVPESIEETSGLELFMANGCGACHQLRGTMAQGRLGPDLTHVGSRMSLGSATLPNDAEGFERWIADNQHVKPENLMPPFRQFSAKELSLLATFLDSLE